MKHRKQEVFLKKWNFISNLNSLDKALLIGAALLFFFSIKFIVNDSSGVHIIDNEKGESLGFVTFQSNDTRYKPANSFSWSKSNQQQKVYQSDSLFVGEKSQAEVQISAKGKLNIGENSLVVFNKVQNQDVANLQLGNFSLNVHGKVKLAIQDEIIELDGKETKIQIVINKNKSIKPLIKAIQGKAKVVINQKSIEIEKDTILPVLTTAVANKLDIPPDVQIEEPLRIPLPVSEAVESRTYFWKLYDLYQLKNGELSKKEEMPETVELQHQLQWKNFPEEQQDTYVTVANSKEFLPNFRTMKAKDNQINIGEVFIGKNYWRISHDQKNWSATHELNVTAMVRTPAPKMDSLKNNFAFDNAPIYADVRINHVEAVKGAVLEISESPYFPIEQTLIQWTAKPQAQIKITEPSTLYVRSRSVFLNNELSDYSNTIQIYSYQMQRLVKVRKLKPVVVKSKVEKVIAEKEKPAARKMASPEPKIEARVPEPEIYYNRIVEKRLFDLEAGPFQLSSTDQQSLAQPSPAGVALGVGFNYWMDQNGFRVALKSKVANTTSTPTGSSMRFDAYYLRRLNFSLMPYLQITGMAGVEVYQNSGASLLAPRYELAKLGGSVMLPVGYHWAIGGAAFYGYGFDQSRQYELNGRLQYYWDRRWFLGLGYRLKLFEAGSIHSAPASLPYRETSEESYGQIGYQF